MRKPLLLAATLLAISTPPAVARPIDTAPARASPTSAPAPARPDWGGLGLAAAFGAGSVLSIALVRRGRAVRDHPVGA